jgi:phosphatidylglycerol:prolipoprotein diacylglycerol transferase
VTDGIAFQLGPLAVHWYGIFIATAVLAAGLLGTAEARRRGESPDVGWSMLLPVLVAGVIGARLYHVLHEWDFYAADPALIPQVWNGGLGIPGAVAGGVVAIWLYSRYAKLNTLRWMDIFAASILLGQAIGRLGNFANQELYGPPTTLPWGIGIDAANRLPEWSNLSLYPVETTRFHPLFAYEAGLNLVGLALILWISRRFAHRLYDGDVLAMYLVWYGLVRSYLETFRVQNWIILGIPTATWLGILAVIGGLAVIFIRHRNGWGTPGAWIREKEQREADAAAAGDTSTEPSPG